MLLKNTGKQRDDKLQIEKVRVAYESGAGESGTTVSGGSMEEEF